MKVEIFTDGAVSGTPGPGGWGALLRMGDYTKTVSGGVLSTTNNRMELMGAIDGLESLKRPCEVTITTDSEYVQKGMSEWLAGWRLKGRLDPNGKKPIKNLDLWLRLIEAAKPHQVTWKWVRGHSGHTENEIADQLAGDAKRLVMTEGADVRLVDGVRVDVEIDMPELSY